MADNSKRVMAGVGAAVGAFLAVLGVRGVKRWLERREHDQQYQQRVLQRMRIGRTGHGLGNAGVRVATVAASNQPVDQPDYEAIPSTGVEQETVAGISSDVGTAVSPPISIDRVAAPLAGYLLAFHSLIETLKERREAGSGTGGRSLALEDRARFQEALKYLRDQLPGVDEQEFEEGAPQVRMHRLALKVRDALENTGYEDDDLFRINGEVRVEACQILGEMMLTGGDYDLVRQSYQCS